MKKVFSIIAAASLLLGLAACGGEGAKDTLTGTPAEVLAQVREASRADLPVTAGSEITAETAQQALGLAGAHFIEYVESAYMMAPLVTTTAHASAMIKCGDHTGALQVKQLIASGFDTGKWSGSVPEQCAVVESGSYVMLAAGTAEATDAFVRAFGSICDGNAGDPDVFFRGGSLA